MSPIDHALLLHETGQKLRLTRIKGISTVQLLVSVLLLASVASTIAAFDFLKDNWLSAGITAFALFSMLLSVALIRRYIVALALKGDTLIVTDLKHHSTVASIRSLKNIRSFRLGPFCLTRIVFKLDGIEHKKFIFKRLLKNEADPSVIIKRILTKHEKRVSLVSR